MAQSKSSTVHIKDIVSCCAVALAQHFGQNDRFPQQLILGAQRFGPQPKNWLRAFLLALGDVVLKHCFSNSPLVKTKISPLFELAAGECFLGLCF